MEGDAAVSIGYQRHRRGGSIYFFFEYEQLEKRGPARSRGGKVGEFVVRDGGGVFTRRGRKRRYRGESSATSTKTKEEPEEEVEVEDQQKTITGSDNEENENNFVSNAVPPNHMLGYNHAIQEMMRSVVDQSNRPRPSSSANDGTVEEEEDLEEDTNNDEGFRIQNLVSNNSPKGPSWKAAKPDIINSMEKERIVKAIRQKYWSNKDKDGLSSARQLSKEE